MIIDFHTHIFPDKICPTVVEKLGQICCSAHFTDGSRQALLSSMAQSGISLSVNLPAMTSPSQVESIHDRFLREQENDVSDGILNFGGMHPDYEPYRKELRRIRQHGFAGIKLHPAYFHTDFDDPRMLRIMDAASEEGLIILTHAGLDIGIYDRNYCSVKQILHVLEEVKPPKLVLAHMGNWGCWDETARDLAGSPVWFDTAFSLGPIVQEPAAPKAPFRSENMDADTFVRLCRAHGTERILFGTDSPWEDQKKAVERIRALPLTDSEQQQILCQNAQSLLPELPH